jgi:hypothetical protein
MSFAHCIAPAVDMCTVALSGKHATGALRKKLRQHWEALHRLTSKAGVISLGKVSYPTLSKCHLAGFCLHTVEGRVLQAFVHQFERGIDSMIKREQIRDLYDNNALVVRLSVSPDGPRRWFHIGYGNLTTLSFELLALDEETDTLRARLAAAHMMVALAADTNKPFCGAVNVWQACRGLPFSKPIDLDCFRLASSSVVLDQFRPMDVFVSNIGIDVPSVSIWSGTVGSIASGSDGGGACHAVEGEGDEDDDDDEQAHDQHNAGVADEASDDDIGDEVPPQMLEAYLMLQGADLSQELESDDEGDPLPDDHGPPEPVGVPGGGVPGDVGAGDAAAPQAPLLVPELVAGPAVGKGKGRGRGKGRRAPPGGYDAIPYGNGYLKVRPSDASIDAHCTKCGNKVDRKSRAYDGDSTAIKFRSQGRPVGFLLLWLQYDCEGDRGAHGRAGKHWSLLPGLKYADRCRLRQEARDRPELEDVFKAERDPWHEELGTGEPHGLVGY